MPDTILQNDRDVSHSKSAVCHIIPVSLPVCLADRAAMPSSLLLQLECGFANGIKFNNTSTGPYTDDGAALVEGI